MEDRSYLDGNGQPHFGKVSYPTFNPKIRALVRSFAKGNMSVKSFMKRSLI